MIETDWLWKSLTNKHYTALLVLKQNKFKPNYVNPQTRVYIVRWFKRVWLGRPRVNDAKAPKGLLFKHIILTLVL